MLTAERCIFYTNYTHTIRPHEWFICSCCFWFMLITRKHNASNHLLSNTDTLLPSCKWLLGGKNIHVFDSSVSNSNFLVLSRKAEFRWCSGICVRFTWIFKKHLEKQKKKINIISLNLVVAIFYTCIHYNRHDTGIFQHVSVSIAYGNWLIDTWNIT